MRPLGNTPDTLNTEDNYIEQPADNPKQSDITLSNNPEPGNTDEAITNKAQTADKNSADTDSTCNAGIKKLKQSKKSKNATKPNQSKQKPLSDKKKKQRKKETSHR